MRDRERERERTSLVSMSYINTKKKKLNLTDVLIQSDLVVSADIFIEPTPPSVASAMLYTGLYMLYGQ
jgi:hypothetical protein